MTEPILPPPIHNLEPKGPSKGTKRVNKIVIGALILIAFGLLILFKWGVEDTEVLTIGKEPFPVRTIREHPTEGGVVFLTADYCKTKDVEGELRISFVSETREVFLPVSSESGDKTCRNFELPVVIPQDIPPDTYRVKLRLVYDVNPLKQDVVQEFYSEPVIIDPVKQDNKLPEESNLQGRPSTE